MSFASNSVIAKARAVYGRSLSAEDYAQLAAKRSVHEAAAFLKQTERCGGVLSGINPQTVHRGQLEALLSRAVFDVFERFHKFDHSSSRVFFRMVVERLEIVQLITLLEDVAAGSTENYILALPMFLTEHSSVPLTQLAKAESFGDVDALLGGTPYGKTLSPLLSAADNGEFSIAECERRLLTAYYMRCLKTIERSYKGSEKTELKRAVLKCVDMINVVTCCRMKAFGVHRAEEIKHSLLPFHYRLSDEAIERLAQSPDIARTGAELAALGYRTDSDAQFDSAEQLADTISLSYFRRQLRLSRSSAVVCFALAQCLGVETGNIKTVIEGIRYGLSGGEILSMLVL